MNIRRAPAEYDPRRGKKYRRVIVWMRRALRVHDNTALWLATREADEIVPVVCLRPDTDGREATPRRQFIRDALIDLSGSLRNLGSALVLRYGDPRKEIPSVASEYSADAVYAVNVFDEPRQLRDAVISRTLKTQGIDWSTIHDTLLLEPTAIVSSSGEPYKVFGAYKRAWLARSGEIPSPLPSLSALPSPPSLATVRRAAGLSAPDTIVRPGGETQARLQLRRFVRKKLASYAERRDLLAKDATSRLSAHLANGTISIREVYHAAREVRSRGNAVARTSADTFITELIWREFFYQILAHHPFVLRRSFRDGIPADSWSGTRRHLRAWCEGRTGYPIVDAGMRQLNSEGWMHNRARMIVASFLVKDLHIDWRKGERYFLDRLIDADLASNNGGWQWVAGTGTDASPWFRIFNPVTQSRRFDPSGAYIRRYVPELASVPAPLVHSPWLMSRDDQVRTHCRIGKDYPLPIVDHNVERAVALAMFRVAKTGGRGGEP